VKGPVLGDGRLDRGEKVVLVTMACALGCTLISILFGMLAALYYVPPIAAWMARRDLSLVQLRPLHTTFASAWIFLAAVACVYKFLDDRFGAPSAADMKRFRLQMVCWGTAGLGALVTLPFGVTSGREYLGFHPALSSLIAVGWSLFAWTFFTRVAPGFWRRPVYVYMWSVGILLFLWTFAEGHAYLLPFVGDRPLADLQIQWKSCGTLVASFNLMVYGALLYLGERRSGDVRIAQSRTAFALFGVTVLNSFTNYGHHTYHLPQSHVVKWVAFVVSMLEVVILVRVFHEVTAAVPRRRVSYRPYCASSRLLVLSKRWNLFLLSVAILISVPPLNALIHGTHVVMAHAMGSELAIDSYVLLAFFAWTLAEIFPKREVRESIIDNPAVRESVELVNAALVCLVALLLLRGLTAGVTRYLGLEDPAWIEGFPYTFGLVGIVLSIFLARALYQWLPLFLRPTLHRTWREGSAPATELEPE